MPRFLFEPLLLDSSIDAYSAPAGESSATQPGPSAASTIVLVLVKEDALLPE
jgi:hypothetical protein